MDGWTLMQSAGWYHSVDSGGTPQREPYAISKSFVSHAVRPIQPRCHSTLSGFAETQYEINKQSRKSFSRTSSSPYSWRPLRACLTTFWVILFLPVARITNIRDEQNLSGLTGVHALNVTSG